jgi:HlyD family type I secretion membrane fusion protein
MRTQREEDLQSANDRSTRNYVIAGIVIVVFFFGGLGAWAALFPFSGAVIAPGVVKVSMERKTIQHLEGGIIDKIIVREGDTVKEGQVLVRLKSSQIEASVSLLEGQLWLKLAESARLKAEGLLAEQIEWPDELDAAQAGPALKKILDEERTVFVTRRKDLAGKIQLYASQIEQFNEKIIGAKEEKRAHEKIIGSLREELAAKKALFQERYIDKTQVLSLERALADHEGQAGRLRQVIAETRQKIEELKLRIIDLRNTYQDKAVTELSRVNDQIFEIREQLKPRIDQKERLEIKAPMAGVVINLQIHSEDAGVIQPGQPLMDIVPENADLIIETKVRTDQITKVKQGQAAKVQLTAFNRREIPPIAGTVTYVSADQLTERTAAGEMPFYVSHIEIPEKELEDAGAYLSPGMPAVCYITTETRTIVDYLLEPIMENLDKALRESN